MLKFDFRSLLRSTLILAFLTSALTAVTPLQQSVAAQDAECVIGSLQSCPATSPQEIYNLYGTDSDGIYWLRVNGTSTRVYLKMTRSGSDNGGWVLLMKGARGTTNFGYSSDVFTSNNTLNPDSLNENSSDAKFSVYNDLTISKVLAVLKNPTAGTVGAFGDIQNNAFGGHVWLETLSSPNTALWSLQTTQNLNSPATDSFGNVPKTKYYTSSAATTQVFSYQNGFGRYGFNGSPCTNLDFRYRWGIAWNQESDWNSCDVVVGIGLAGTTLNSPGDQVRWNGVTTGSVTGNTGHGNMDFQIWGKVAEPSLAAPTSVTSTNPSAGQVNLSWSAPSGVTVTDYVVQYKTSAASNYSNSFIVSGQTTASVSGLNGGTTYNFRVFARTSSNSTSDPSTSTVSTVVKASQTLAFSTTSYAKAFGETQTVTATSAGTGAITYSVGASTACSVSGSTVTLTASSGTCSITASRAADANYFEATSTNSVTITVSKAVQATLILTSTSTPFLTNLMLVTTGGSGSGAVSYSVSSSGTAGCSVINGDSLTSTSAGTCVVVAKKENSTNFLDAYDTRTVTISKATLALTTSVASTLKYGSTATATYSSSRALGIGSIPAISGSLAYETSTTTACDINGSTGSITMKKASGSCNIRVRLSNDSNYLDTTSAIVSITPAQADAITITAENKTSIFNGAAASITPTYSVSGLQFQDTVTVTYGYTGVSNAGDLYSFSSTKPTEAGLYSIIPLVTLTNSESYTTSASTNSGTLTIARASRTLSPTVFSKDALKYGESATVTSNVTSPSTNQDGEFLYTVGAGCSIDSSSGTITATQYSGYCLATTTIQQGNNYESAAATPVSFALSKADTITVTASSPAAVTYTGSAAAVTPTVSVSGLVAGDTATGATFTYSRAPNCASGGVCQVGDTGPGGGKVFYVSGSTINGVAGISGGGMYLELAPSTFSKTPYNWCEGPGNPYTTLFGATATTIGSGAANTKIMTDNCTGGAGVEAANLTLGGQSDWFLPSYGELVEIYNQRTMLGLGTGRFASTFLYWSSTEADNWIASSLVPWAGVGGQNKAQATPFLPIRAFSPTSTTYETPTGTPTNAGTYRINPSALTLSGGITTDYYVATLYEPGALTINKATQAAFTNYSTLSGIFGITFPIVKFGGSGSGAEIIETTNGSATGCSLSGSFLSASSSGTCFVAASKESSENYAQSDSLFSVNFFYYVPEPVAPVSTMPSQIAIAAKNTWSANATAGPTITSISPSSGPVGTVITITGTGLNGVDVIKIGRRLLTSITGVSSTSMTAVIPSGATTGPIMVSNSFGGDFSPSGFTVTP